MSIENFKNPWVDKWKKGGEFDPDWLGEKKALDDQQISDKTNSEYKVTLNGEVNGVKYGDCPRPNYLCVI